MADEGISRREFDALAARVDRIDEHGTRGVSVLQQQQAQLSRDMGKLESTVERSESILQTVQMQLVTLKPGRGVWLRDLALMLPMYALVIDLIARGHG